MKVVRGDLLPFEAPNVGHRQRGKAGEGDAAKDDKTIEFKHLLAGEENTLENFALVLSRQGAVYSPRHKHNFDQFRFVWKGDCNIGKGVTLREGQIGYFPEGTPYGPQDDGPGERLLLVLQFGAISRQGYLSTRQLRAAAEELRQIGKFEDGAFVRETEDGITRQDGFEAVWEHHNKVKLVYSRPRYRDPVVISPVAFGWIDADKTGNVKRKPLGTFTERQTRAEMLRFEAAGTHRFEPEEAIRLIFVTEGSGTADGQEWRVETAMQVDPGEVAMISANGSAEMLILTLPMLASMQGATSEHLQHEPA